MFLYRQRDIAKTEEYRYKHDVVEQIHRMTVGTLEIVDG